MDGAEVSDAEIKEFLSRFTEDEKISLYVFAVRILHNPETEDIAHESFA
jgi:hypothetical protein